LGKLLTPAILEEIDYDLKNTVFSYIPNTASVAFQGMMDRINTFSSELIKDKILKSKDNLSRERLDAIFNISPRVETIAVKDVKTPYIYYAR